MVAFLRAALRRVVLSLSVIEPLAVREALPRDLLPSFASTAIFAPGAARTERRSFFCFLRALSEAVLGALTRVRAFAFVGVGVVVGMGVADAAGVGVEVAATVGMETVKSRRSGVGSTLPAAS